MPDDSFKEFVLDQLATLPEVRARAMFGAHGLYQADRFFGILDEGRLFFKVSESSRTPYVERGMEPFTYQSKGETVTLGFYEVPPDVLENAPELGDWARQAVKVAGAAKAMKKTKKAAGPAGKIECRHWRGISGISPGLCYILSLTQAAMLYGHRLRCEK